MLRFSRIRKMFYLNYNTEGNETLKLESIKDT